MLHLSRILTCLLFVLPAWAATAADKPALISIIIDDIGNNLHHGQRAIALPGAITYSVLPFTPFGKQLAKQAHQQGKEVMLHLPMDNSHGRPLGPGGLTFKQERPIFEQQMAQAIAATPYVSGINNHMGSGLTTSNERMQWLMQALKEYPLYFVDSRTSVASVAARTALALKIPTLERDIFLDHEATPEFTEQQFKRLIKKARIKGSALAIGHPYPSTLDYLEKVLPQLDSLGVQLVSPSHFLALHNTPQLIATKTQEATVNAIEPPTSLVEATPAKLKPQATTLLTKASPEQKSEQCRISEQLDVTRVVCS